MIWTMIRDITGKCVHKYKRSFTHMQYLPFKFLRMLKSTLCCWSHVDMQHKRWILAVFWIATWALFYWSVEQTIFCNESSQEFDQHRLSKRHAEWETKIWKHQYVMIGTLNDFQKSPKMKQKCTEFPSKSPAHCRLTCKPLTAISLACWRQSVYPRGQGENMQPAQKAASCCATYLLNTVPPA